MRCDALQRFLFQLISVVARPILVVGSKSYLVHQGKMVQQHCSCLDMGPIIAEVQSRGNLCWAAQCILPRVLGKTCWFWAVPPSNAHPVTPLTFPGGWWRPFPLGVEKNMGVVTHFELMLIFRQPFERRLHGNNLPPPRITQYATTRRNNPRNLAPPTRSSGLSGST